MIARRSSALLKRWAMRVPRTIGGIAQEGFQRFGGPCDTGTFKRRGIPEAVNAAGRSADDTQQMRSDAVSRCLELMARTAALLKQLLTWRSLLRQSRRGVA